MAVLTSHRTIGLEIAATRLIAVEVDRSTDPPTILKATARAVPAGTLDGALLKSLMVEGGITGRQAHLVLSPPDSTHRIEVLPSMTGRERQLYLERGLARELGGNLLVGHQTLGQTEDAVRKDEVLVVAVPRKEVDQPLSALLDARLIPHLVTTAPLASLEVARSLSPFSLDRPTAVVHWGFRALTVTVVERGTIRLTREIPQLAVPGLQLSEWFVTEFQRTVRQYTVASKGEPVGAVVVGSVDANFERVLPEVEARLPGVSVFNLNEAIRGVLPPETEELAGVPAGAFLLPLGVAMLSSRETANLLPRSIVEARQSRLLKTVGGVVAALLVLSLGYSFWGAAWEVASYRRALAVRTAAKQTHLARVRGVERILREREIQRQRIHLLTQDPLGGPPLADVLKEISRLAPDHLRLEELALSRDKAGTRMRLTGAVEFADIARAQSEFNRFYFGLGDSPFFFEVRYGALRPEVQTSQRRSKEGRRARDLRRKAQPPQSTQEMVTAEEDRLAFELTLHLKELR
ncbi:MAG: type IV pilus biogenesis protein PilM [Candidatus Methylomirabilia bacterium]